MKTLSLLVPELDFLCYVYIEYVNILDVFVSSDVYVRNGVLFEELQRERKWARITNDIGYAIILAKSKLASYARSVIDLDNFEYEFIEEDF